MNRYLSYVIPVHQAIGLRTELLVTSTASRTTGRRRLSRFVSCAAGRTASCRSFSRLVSCTAGRTAGCGLFFRLVSCSAGRTTGSSRCLVLPSRQIRKCLCCLPPNLHSGAVLPSVIMIIRKHFGANKYAPFYYIVTKR